MNRTLKPFLLDHHEREFARLRALRPEEMKEVAGGLAIPTLTVTPNYDGGDDTQDC